MPTQTVKVYPGQDYDFSFGSEATVAWDGSGPTFDIVDDASGAPDGLAGRFSAAFADAKTGYAEYKSAAALSGISISAVRMYARFLAKGTAGTYGLTVTGFLRPAGAGFGTTGAYFGTPVAITSESADAEVYHDELIGTWATDPATAVAFTLSTVNSMSWGARLAAAATDPAVNGGVKLDSIYLEIDVANIAADIDGVRFVGSSFLRLFRRAIRMLDLEGPLALADVELFETFSLDHILGPTPDGLGWGALPWQRRQLIPITKTYNPMRGTVRLKCIDPRDFYTNWWSTFLTDIGHSLDGQGIPLLHSGGGGIAVDRGQVAYVERPGNPHDGLMMDVSADLPPYAWDGLQVEGAGATNSLLNSSFSQGAGSAMDNWTETETGTGVVEPSTTLILFDVSGLRRSCRLFCGAGDSANAYNQADAVSVTGPFRVRIRTYNNFGAGKLGCKIRRATDSFDWNDDSEAFEAAPDPNRIGNDAGGWNDWVSKLIDPGGADDITVFVGYFGEAGTINYEAFAGSVEIITGSTVVGSDLPTTTTPVTRIESYVTIRNDEVGRVWDPTRGSFTCGVVPWFDAADLEACEEKIILHMAHKEGVTEEILFKRGGVECGGTAGKYYWIFRRNGEEASFEASGDTLPVRGTGVKIAVRWTATDGELGLPSYTFQIFVNDVKGEVDGLLAAVPEIDPTATITVGSDGDASWSDSKLRHFDFCPLVLLDEELQRRPS